MILLCTHAPAALAVPCESSGREYNYAVQAAPARDKLWATGLSGDVTVRSLNIQQFKGWHIESLYVWNDFLGNMVEYGWWHKRTAPFDEQKKIFSARFYQGDGKYLSNAFRDTVDGPLNLKYKHAANNPNRWDFYVNHDITGHHRWPPFKKGVVTGGGEIENQCDDGTTRWLGLRKRSSNDTEDD